MNSTKKKIQLIHLGLDMLQKVAGSSRSFSREIRTLCWPVSFLVSFPVIAGHLAGHCQSPCQDLTFDWPSFECNFGPLSDTKLPIRYEWAYFPRVCDFNFDSEIFWEFFFNQPSFKVDFIPTSDTRHWYGLNEPFFESLGFQLPNLLRSKPQKLRCLCRDLLSFICRFCGRKRVG